MAETPEKRQRAKELYVFYGLTLDEASRQAGVTLSACQRWSAEEGWKAMQTEYREAQADINHYTVLLRARLVKKVYESLSEGREVDAQALYALNKLAAQKGADAAPVPGLEPRDIRTPEDAVSALEEAVKSKINLMLSRPEALSLQSVKEVKEMQKMVDEMNAKYKTAEERSGGLSDETAAWIREKILKG